MKFEITVKHNKENTDKAIEIIDNLKAMARARKFDMSNELDIKTDVSENDIIVIVPNITFLNGEFYKGKSEEFTEDYLKTYGTANGIVVDFGTITTLD